MKNSLTIQFSVFTIASNIDVETNANVKCKQAFKPCSHQAIPSRQRHRHMPHWQAKWLCNPFCLPQFPSKRSKMPPVNVTLWRLVWMSLYPKSRFMLLCNYAIYIIKPTILGRFHIIMSPLLNSDFLTWYGWVRVSRALLMCVDPIVL